MSWAKEAFAFVTSTLPNLLEKHGEDHVDDAIEELLQVYRSRRVDQLKSRKAEIDNNRAAIDAEIARREIAERNADIAEAKAAATPVGSSKGSGKSSS